MGCSKSNAKRVYSNTSLPQKMRKTSNNQPNLIFEATRKRRKNPPKLVEGKKYKYQSRNKWKEMKETMTKINKTKS